MSPRSRLLLLETTCNAQVACTHSHTPRTSQEGLDIDVLVHGEAERTDMSEHFGGC